MAIVISLFVVWLYGTSQQKSDCPQYSFLFRHSSYLPKGNVFNQHEVVLTKLRTRYTLLQATEVINIIHKAFAMPFFPIVKFTGMKLRQLPLKRFK
jgi:hypothetical protein